MEAPMYRSLLVLFGLLTVPSFALAAPFNIYSPYGNASTSVGIGQNAAGNNVFAIRRVSDGDCSLQAVAPGTEVNYWAGAAADAIVVVPTGATWTACHGATLSAFAPGGSILRVYGGGGADVILAGSGVSAYGQSENDIILNYGGGSWGGEHSDTLVAGTWGGTLRGESGNDLLCVAQGVVASLMDGGAQTDKSVGTASATYNVEGPGLRSDCDFAVWLAFLALGA
jgi:hypothetical protein